MYDVSFWLCMGFMLAVAGEFLWQIVDMQKDINKNKKEREHEK